METNLPSANNNSRGNLPASMVRLVGRDPIVELIHDAVASKRLISIVGAGGIGKTTVALAVANRARDYSDGVWFVDLATLQDGSLVSHAINASIGLTVHSGDALAATSRYFRSRKALLVLDNCEHIVGDVAACAERIMSEAQGVRIVVTSREPLRLSGEHVHRLLPLQTPSEDKGTTAVQALEYSAVQLFVERARDRLESFSLRDDEAPLVGAICRRLDGIALAIELAAMRVDAFGVKGLLRQLDDRFRILTGGRVGLQRHRTLAATLDWSYTLLLEDEASMMRALSGFAGAFTAVDASAVSCRSLAETTDILTELAAKSLLSIDGNGPDAIYRLLDTTREYCASKLASRAEDDAVHIRHAEHLCELLEEANYRSSQRSAVELGRYLGDLRKAIVWARSNPSLVTTEVRLIAAGAWLWNQLSLTDESRLQITRALEILSATEMRDTQIELTLQLNLAGAVLYTRGVVPEARAAMRRALDIAEARGDADAQLRCLRVVGTYELFSGDHDAGIATLESFLKIAAKLHPDALPEGETHLAAGEIWTGNLRAARTRLEKLHWDILPEPEDGQPLRFLYDNRVNTLVVLAHAQWLTGSPREAISNALKGVELARKANHELSMSIALAWACPVLFWSGLHNECADHVAMLDEIVERHGILTWRPTATFYRGALVALAEGSRCQGIEIMGNAVDQFREIGQTSRLPHYLGVLAESLSRQGHFSEASVRIDEALELARKQNEQWCLPELLRIRSAIPAAGVEGACREALLRLSIAKSDEVGALSWKLRSSLELAGLLDIQERTEEARQTLEVALAQLGDRFETRDMVGALELSSQLGCR
ncbi:AAA family ATPase [Rhizobium brockwellii]|uniref:ATP-binding protein n=1 Tax=Rhizobium brockwellii TaxID=3019932 RepID=UPI003F9A64C1